MGGAADGLFTRGDPLSETLQTLGLKPQGYFLHVGNFVPRKNIPFLIETHSESQVHGEKIPLVLVGAGEWGDLNLQEERPGVIVLRNTTDTMLLDLYRGARALLMPSECEGLGLPVLEAFACGIPVISSNTTALAETVGTNGIKLDPADHQAWVTEIVSLKDPQRVDELRRMSRAAQRNDWQDIAVGICGFYRKISGL